MTVEALGEYGVEEMSDDDIRQFLSSQSTAVLGLPAESGPYMFPMSYQFDGESGLYFTFVLNGESRKRDLVEASEDAAVLVYRVDTPFNWESVQLAGWLEPVEGEPPADVEPNVWRPKLFERASTDTRTDRYRFVVEARAGIRHVGLPSKFQR